MIYGHLDVQIEQGESSLIRFESQTTSCAVWLTICGRFLRGSGVYGNKENDTFRSTMQTFNLFLQSRIELEKGMSMSYHCGCEPGQFAVRLHLKRSMFCGLVGKDISI